MIALFLAASLARADVTASADPVVGVPVTLTVTRADGRPAGGQTVRVVHRPGLAGQRELALGITDPRGEVHWTPEIAGPALVGTDSGRVALRVTPASVPVETALLYALVVAAGLAGIGYGARELAATLAAARPPARS